MQPLRPDLPDSASQRRTMVDCQIRTFGVTDQRLIARLLDVPRERFLPDDVRGLAYSDIGFTVPAPTPGGEARYLLPPMVLARLIQGARVSAQDKVLDVASGTGYSTAILAALAAEVAILEDDAAALAEIEARLASIGISGVTGAAGPLAEGARAKSPYDVIVVNGAVETNLDGLFAQLADGGRLVAIRRDPTDPTGRAAKAICYEKGRHDIGSRPLFDASAPTLLAFRKEAQFVF